MADTLPTEYDCIVIGTGMTESIVAAAASRVGKRVLHLDANEYYGGLWASFNFDGLQNWLDDCRKQRVDSQPAADNTLSSLLKDGETTVKAGNQFSTISNITENWLISEGLPESLSQLWLSKKTQTGEENDEPNAAGDAKCPEESEKYERDSNETEKVEDTKSINSPRSRYWTQRKMKSDQRKFNIDLAPKLLFARGALVELLISSNIARYAEFRSVTRVLTWLGGRLESVPCSRADVFATRHVSVVEKRMLMKLLTICMEYENNSKEFEGFEDRTFLEFLKSRKLTPNLIHYVLYAISMSTDRTSCKEGVVRTQRFLNSLGRYGNTPFLWPMYGSGEIPQCFCRLCAVFGGLYHLKRSAEALILGPGADGGQKCLGIVSESQRLDASHLVLGVGFAPPEYLKEAPTGGLSRGVFVTDRSISPAEKETLTLLQFPAVDGKCEPVTVIELGPSTNSCPQGLYVVHMTSKQTVNAQVDLEPIVEKLLNNEPYVEESEPVATKSLATQTAALVEEAGTSGEKSDEEKQVKVEEEKRDDGKKPQVLWSLCFNCPETSGCDLSASVPDNVFLCSGPDLDLDFEFAVKQAKEIFTKMYPDCEFLPRAPDPEEIVLEGEETIPGPSFEGTSETSDKELQNAETEASTEKELADVPENESKSNERAPEHEIKE